MRFLCCGVCPLLLLTRIFVRCVVIVVHFAARARVPALPIRAVLLFCVVQFRFTD